MLSTIINKYKVPTLTEILENLSFTRQIIVNVIVWMNVSAIEEYKPNNEHLYHTLVFTDDIVFLASVSTTDGRPHKFLHFRNTCSLSQTGFRNVRMSMGVGYNDNNPITWLYRKSWAESQLGVRCDSAQDFLYNQQSYTATITNNPITYTQ